jgi:uracil phosphoribosyltransferase
MCEAEKYLSKKGIISPLPEMTMEYIGFIANRATGQPIEFFMKLPPKDATKVKNKVTSFFYGED